MHAQSVYIHTKNFGNYEIPTSNIDSITADSSSQRYIKVHRMAKPYFVQGTGMVNHRYGDTQMESHRGYRGYPENTFCAILKAIKMGYKVIECDIAFTKDNIAVLSHDSTIDRCSNGKGCTTDYTYAELQQFDFGFRAGKQFWGERIPTLESILKLCKAHNVILELDCATKSRFPNYRYQQVYNLVKRQGMLNSTIFCDEPANLKHLLKIDKNVIVSISYILSEYFVDGARCIYENARLTDCSVPYDCLTQELVDYIHSKGMYVKTWTVDGQDNVLLALQYGVDRIISNTIGPELPDLMEIRDIPQDPIDEPEPPEVTD